MTPAYGMGCVPWCGYSGVPPSDAANNVQAMSGTYQTIENPTTDCEECGHEYESSDTRAHGACPNCRYIEPDGSYVAPLDYESHQRTCRGTDWNAFDGDSGECDTCRRWYCTIDGGEDPDDLFEDEA